MWSLRKKIVLTAYLLLCGCASYYPLNPDAPSGYFEYWCDPNNSNGLVHGENSAPKQSFYYEFHDDRRFVSKDECLEHQQFGTYGLSSIKRKQLDDRLDEQIAEARKKKK